MRISRNRLLLAAAAAAAGLGVNSVAGASGATGEEPRAPSPGTGYAQTGSPLGDEQIAQIAHAVAARAGDASPALNSAGTSMSAVSTTLAAAVGLSGTQMRAGNPGEQALMASNVVVVVQRGSFTLADAPVKRGSGAPHGSVLTLTIDSHTGWVDCVELTNAPPAGLAALGPSRPIGASITTATAASSGSGWMEVTVLGDGRGAGRLASRGGIKVISSGEQVVARTTRERLRVRLPRGRYLVSTNMPRRIASERGCTTKRVTVEAGATARVLLRCSAL